jgi:dolichyl-phosphate-mannose--protein O-mannosyl transferase
MTGMKFSKQISVKYQRLFTLEVLNNHGEGLHKK